MEEPPVLEAFVRAAEKYFRVFGQGPYDGLRTIGDTYGRGWSMIANTTRRTLEGISPCSIAVYRNGLPHGIIGPYGGSIISLEEPGKAEADFIRWCGEDEPKDGEPIADPPAESIRQPIGDVSSPGFGPQYDPTLS